ncbi:MAG: hydroxymethylbilane synthase [Cellvibrionaceae bacterium]|jgi:hydroxymethylbilane synthase
MLLKIGSRGSKLALTQTNLVARMLENAWAGLSCEVEIFTTQGDRTQAAGIPLPEIGGKGLFTSELESALRDGRIDLAIHSLKDLPVEDAPGLVVGAIPVREDVRDVVVSRSGLGLDELPAGAVIGTSSIRRQAQILFHRPDLVVKSIRGNVDTRIGKVMGGDYDAAVLAASGLIRLGIEAQISEYLPNWMMLPAPGQGALGVQCRANDSKVQAYLDGVSDTTSRLCVTAERVFLQALGGGCSLPVAAHVVQKDGELQFHGRVSSADGRSRVEVKIAGTDPEKVGTMAAEIALAQGAKRLLGGELPLLDKRVLVTREQLQAKLFVEKLLAKGAIPVEFPVLQFQPLHSAELDNLDINTFDWVVFTSGNAVRQFFAHQNFVNSRWLASDAAGDAARKFFKVAASGSTTAAVLENFGIWPDFVPEQFIGEQLVSGLGDLEGKRVLLPRSKQGRPEIAEILRQNGAILLEIPLYDTVVTVPSPAEWANFEMGFDILTFTSPTSVKHLIHILENKNQSFDSVKNKLIASIGPVTSQALVDAGLPVHIEADPYTMDGVISSIEEYISQSKSDA